MATPAARRFAALAAEGALPLPAGGQSLLRLKRLAQACADESLSVGKLYESHHDALAILAELGAAGLAAPGSLWGVWAAEGPAGSRLECRRASSDGSCRLRGRKSWCSGAPFLSHALVTAFDADGASQLVAVDLRVPGVGVTDEGWAAVGMAQTQSVDVVFDGATGMLVGEPGDYIARAGFWHGAIGIAACWYGAAQAVAAPLKARAASLPSKDPLLLAQLGTVDVALLGARRVLRDAAEAMDRRPAEIGAMEAQRVRLAVEAAADAVLARVGRALGAFPLCRVAEHAQRVADLGVFLRQSHGERDLASLGGAVAQAGDDWAL